MTEAELRKLEASVAQKLINPLYVNAEDNRYTVHPGKNRVVVLRRLGHLTAPAVIHTRYMLLPWAEQVSPQEAASKFSPPLVAEIHDPRYFAVKRLAR